MKIDREHRVAGGQIRWARSVASSTLVVLLAACGGGGSGGSSPTPPPSSSPPPPPPTFHATAGLAEKGPLITGSAVTAQELNASLSPTGKQYSYQITSDLGEFSPTSDFTSQYVGVSATGYYFDEVLGTVSAGPLTLNSYSDLSADTVMNVNILTTLAYQRIQNLVAQGGKSFADARTQAEQEVLTALKIPAGSYGKFGSLKLTGNNEGAQILAAISSLFVQGNSSGQVNVLINNFQADIGTDGTLDNAQTKLALSVAAATLNPFIVAQNLNTRYGSSGVSFNANDIARWIDRDNDGLLDELHFRVTDASPGTSFTLPAYVVATLDGKEIYSNGSKIFVNGVEYSSYVVHTGDSVAVRAGTFLEGMTTSTVGYSFNYALVRVAFLAPVESLELLPENKRVGINATQSFTARLHFRDGQVFDRTTDFLWSSSAPQVAAMTGYSARALALGTTTITASFGALTASTKLEVVDVVLEDFAFSRNAVDTGVGVAQKLKLTGTYSNDSVIDVSHLASWSSDDPQVATVSNTGVVTGVALGSTNIKATIESITRTLPVTVTAGGVAVGQPMVESRRGHSATLLANGKLLIAGGESDSSSISAELYDPATGTWSSAGVIPNRHAGHATAVLQDGRVLIAGGVGSGPAVGFVEIYNPVTNQWSAARSMSLEVHGLTATTLQNGKVLVTGGNGGLGPIYTNTSQYDPATNTWSAAAPLGSARAYHTATLLADGKVLVAGGFKSIGTAAQTEIAATAELYDPAANSWTPLASMSHARYGHRATLLADGRLLVTGGFDATNVQGAEIYDPASNSWSPAGTMLHPRLWNSAVLLSNGNVMVAGGLIDASGEATDSVEIYDTLTNSWSAGAAMSMPRASHTATRLGNNAVLIVGGSNETAPYIHNSTELIW